MSVITRAIRHYCILGVTLIVLGGCGTPVTSTPNTSAPATLMPEPSQPTTSCPEVPPPSDCSAAVVLTIDKSGSMEADTGGGLTMLDRVKQAAIAAVQDIPPGQWNMGLTTFPGEEGVPEYGMEIITDQPDTRSEIINIINSLSPGGGTDILTAGYEALSLLQTDPSVTIIVRQLPPII